MLYELIRKLTCPFETIMSKVLKFTYTDYARLHFLSKEGYRKILAEIGFEIESVTEIKGVIPYPHFMIVAKKTN